MSLLKLPTFSHPTFQCLRYGEGFDTNSSESQLSGIRVEKPVSLIESEAFGDRSRDG